MFLVRKHIEIDAGHRVPFHASKCRNLHGHRYRVTAVVAAEKLVPENAARSDSSMVVDFGVIKEALMAIVHNVCDHKLLLWQKDPLLNEGLLEGLLEIAAVEQGSIVFLPVIPTAEALAEFWGQTIQAWAKTRWDPRLRLVAVEVHETPTSVAVWERP